jgi:hypothetical protein
MTDPNTPLPDPSPADPTKTNPPVKSIYDFDWGFELPPKPRRRKIVYKPLETSGEESELAELRDPIPTEQPKPPRRRGGQPGNCNAVKHGLYIDGSRLRNTTPVEQAVLFDVNDIITAIKDYMRYTYETGLNTKNLTEINETMRSLSLAAMGLTRLINAHSLHINTYLPENLKKREKSSVQALLDHYRKMLAPIADISDFDLNLHDE